ncbi:hypothetical protein [Neisseria zalophi]|uniref:hypothetical protein n=1 Tax=Neisseria zalophi TaxID=640030 RepID=UPI00177C5B26|nr:hypothetical protein [Neisseria zalophi]
MNQDPIGLWGGNNVYRLGYAIQTWTDPLGLEGKIFLQKLDEKFAGINVEGTIALGFGFNGSLEYAGEGKLSCSIALTAGAGAEIGVSKSVPLAGKKDDGFYSEVCGTAKFFGSGGACFGSTLKKNQKPYTTTKIGGGLGGGVTANIGYQKTFDLMGSALQHTEKHQ